MVETKLSPVAFNVPLVDPKTGFPTPYFERMLSVLFKEKAETDALAEEAVSQEELGDALEGIELDDLADVNLTGEAQGNILMRDADDWQVLAPGSAGKVLTAHGAGADLTWETPAGASGTERTRVIPTNAGYTIQNAGGSFTATDTTYGMFLEAPGSTQIRMLRKNGAPPATPYSIIMRGAPVFVNSGPGYTNCIILRNNTSGRILISGWYNGDYNFLIQKWNGYNSYGSDLRGPTFWPYMANLPWQKMTNDGTNLTWYHSPDGVAWTSHTTTTLANFITATGGTLDEIGFGSFLSGTANSWVCQSFEAV